MIIQQGVNHIATKMLWVQQTRKAIKTQLRITLSNDALLTIHCAVLSRYCEIIINRWVLIFVDFMLHLNHENYNPTEYNLSIDCCI
jgi:hypothetical protein